MNALATAGPVALRQGTRRLSPLALVVVVLAHIAALFTLLATQGIHLPQPASALMVSLVQAQTPSRQAAVVPQTPTARATAPQLPVRTTQSPQQRVPSASASPVLASESPLARPALDAASADKALAPATSTAPNQPPSNASATPRSVVAAPSANANASSASPSSATASTSPSVQAQAPSAPRFDADYLDNPAPVYPPLSRRGAEQGTVMLRVYVEAGGQAAKVELRSSSGYERLDRAAITAVSRWKFVPARQGADAVAAWVVVPIVFSLKV